VKKSLSLPFAAGLVSRLTVTFNLPNVSSHRLPPLDLAKVFFRHSAVRITPMSVFRHQRLQNHSQPVAFFVPPGGIPPETRAAALTLSLENVVFLRSRKRF
jgi:hypothetical protein